MLYASLFVGFFSFLESLWLGFANVYASFFIFVCVCVLVLSMFNDSLQYFSFLLCLCLCFANVLCRFMYIFFLLCLWLGFANVLCLLIYIFFFSFVSVAQFCQCPMPLYSFFSFLLCL